MAAFVFLTTGTYTIANASGSFVNNELVFSTKFSGVSGSVSIRRKTDSDVNALRVGCTDLLTLAYNSGVLAVNGTWKVPSIQGSTIQVDAVVPTSGSVTVYVA